MKRSATGLVVAGGTGAMGCAVLVLVIFYMVLWPVMKAGHLVHGAVHAISGIAGNIFNASSTGTPAWDQGAVKAVTQTWFTVETKAVNYYCTLSKGRPCVTVPFVQAIMMQESGGNPTAVSSAGALGLMQVMPSHFTFKQDPLRPLTNLMTGVSFLDQLDAMFKGNLPLIAAGYNAGPGAVQEWEQMYGTSSWSTLAAQPYVQAFSGGQTYEYVTYVMAYYAKLDPSAVKKPSGSSTSSGSLVTGIHG